MPPQIMLLANTVLVAYLYRRNSRNGEKVSGISWVFAIWFMIMGSRTLGDWLSYKAYSDIVTGTENNPINVVFGFVFAGFGLYVINKRRLDIAQIIQLNAPLFILFGYCLVSCLWSEGPLISFRRWTRMILDVVVIIAILSEPDRLAAIKKIWERYAIFALPLSIVMIKYFPDMATAWSRDGSVVMWTGVSLHKNALGVGLAACILYYVWKWFVLRNYYTIVSDGLLCLLASYMLFNPEVKGSSTAVLSLIPAVGLMLLFGRRRSKTRRVRPIFYMTLILVSLVCVGAGAFLGKGLLEYVTQWSGRDMTFTGRTFIWDAVIEEAAKSPIVGTGYGMFWVGSRLNRLHAKDLVSGIYQAHNGYLETYASLGVIGLFLLIVVLIVALDRGLKGLAGQFEKNSLVAAYTVLFVLAEFFEATALSYSSFRWIILLLLIIRMPGDTGNLSDSGGTEANGVAKPATRE
jgi:exopolysaccharide production protein ExoQ